MNPPAHSSYFIEPLGDHDRGAFFCGIPELDRYPVHQARQDAKRKVAAPFVVVDRGGKVLGYYRLGNSPGTSRPKARPLLANGRPSPKLEEHSRSCFDWRRC